MHVMSWSSLTFVTTQGTRDAERGDLARDPSIAGLQALVPTLVSGGPARTRSNIR